MSLQSTIVWSTCHCYNRFWNWSLITKSTELCTKAKLGYLVFSKIDEDIDCLNRIEKFKIPLEAYELCFWIIYNILEWLYQIFPEKKSDIWGTYFDSHCICVEEEVKFMQLFFELWRKNSTSLTDLWKKLSHLYVCFIVIEYNFIPQHTHC